MTLERLVAVLVDHRLVIEAGSVDRRTGILVLRVACADGRSVCDGDDPGVFAALGTLAVADIMRLEVRKAPCCAIEGGCRYQEAAHA